MFRSPRPQRPFVPLLRCLTVSTPSRSVALPLRLAPLRPFRPPPPTRPTTTRLYASTSEATQPLDPYTPYVRTRNFVLGTATLAGIVLLTSYYFDSRSAMHRYLLMPLVHATTDPETSHRLAVWALKWGLTPRDPEPDDEILAVKIWGKTLSNPIGLAAGFDKHAEAINGLFNLGFGYVEIGSVTPEPQPGNPLPRMFRLPADRAVINRYGFNSDGHQTVLRRLRDRVRHFIFRGAERQPEQAKALLNAATGDTSVLDSLSPNRSLREGKLLGVNLGKNKATPEEAAASDYVKGVETLGPYADVLIVNVSSPNTPGLRSLQKKEILEGLLKEVIAAQNKLSSTHRPPLLVKVAPDLSDAELRDIAEAALASGIDGIIVSNTTVQRPESLQSDDFATIDQFGGLSGPPLKPLALRALRQLREYTGGRVPLVGCGGVRTGDDALEFARAGASLVQVYTAFAYDGVGLPRRIKDEIVERLRKEGKTWSEIVGADVQKGKSK